MFESGRSRPLTREGGLDGGPTGLSDNSQADPAKEMASESGFRKELRDWGRSDLAETCELRRLVDEYG